MAENEIIFGDERRKTTKTSAEYHKTETESHEVERSDGYEKCRLSRNDYALAA